MLIRIAWSETGWKILTSQDFWSIMEMHAVCKCECLRVEKKGFLWESDTWPITLSFNDTPVCECVFYLIRSSPGLFWRAHFVLQAFTFNVPLILHCDTHKSCQRHTASFFFTELFSRKKCTVSHAAFPAISLYQLHVLHKVHSGDAG